MTRGKGDRLAAPERLARRADEDPARGSELTQADVGKGQDRPVGAHRTGDPGAAVYIDRDWKPTVRSNIKRLEGGARISARSDEEAKRLRERLVKQLAAEGLEIQTRR